MDDAMMWNVMASATTKGDSTAQPPEYETFLPI
jgi:hypothetical protein